MISFLNVSYYGFIGSVTGVSTFQSCLDNSTVNNYMQVTGIATGENFAFFIYRHFVEIL